MPSDARRRSPLEWLLLVVVGGANLALGLFSVQIMLLLIRVLSPGAASRLAAKAGSESFTNRPLLPMVAFGALHVILGIALLHLLLADRQRTRLVVLAYGAVMGVAALLLAAGRLLGLGAVFTPPARALIDFLTSPLPILFGLAVFWLVIPKTQPLR